MPLSGGSHFLLPSNSVPSLKMGLASSTQLLTPLGPHQHVVRHSEFIALTNKLLIGPTFNLCRILNTNAQTQVLIFRVKIDAWSPATFQHSQYFSTLQFWCLSIFQQLNIQLLNVNLSFSYSPTRALYLSTDGLRTVGLISINSNFLGFKSSTQFLVVWYQVNHLTSLWLRIKGRLNVHTV